MGEFEGERTQSLTPQQEHTVKATPRGWPRISSAIFYDDAHMAHALANGATVVEEPNTTDYGAEYWSDRTYSVLDP